MQIPTTPAKPNKARRRAHRTLAGAVFGASATFLVLLGATAVSDSPRQLSDIPETLAAAEVFDGSPRPAFEAEGDVHVLAPNLGRYDEPGLRLNVEVPA
jgi:hypothetical protein